MSPRKDAWSDAENDRLRRAVSVHGAHWLRIVELVNGGVGRRSRDAIKKQWNILRDVVPSPPSPAPAAPGLLQLGLRHGHRKQWPAGVRKAHCREGRDRTGGRPWDYFVTRSCVPSNHQPTERQLDLLKNWNLEPPPKGLIMCNLKVAESTVLRYLQNTTLDTPPAVRDAPLSQAVCDQLHLAYHPGETCHALTSSNANLLWVSCGEGRRGFATREEVASFMGHSPRICCPALNRLVESDRIAKGWLAESVHGRMAVECARVATMHLPVGALRTAGSIYSGACDALVTGFATYGTPLERLFVADTDATKLRVLTATFSPQTCFPSAEQASIECPPVDVLTASPSCHEVSRANLAGEPEDVESSVLTYTVEIVRTVQRAAPLAVVIEQADGLRSHHPELLWRSRAMLDKLPYHWFFLEADGIAMGSFHTRDRLLWVGVRVDAYVEPPAP